MTAVAPQTHLKPTSEVVSHPDTLFLPDGINILVNGHLQFSNGLRTIVIHVVLQELPEIKFWRLRRNGGHFGTCALINVSFELTSVFDLTTSVLSSSFFFFLTYHILSLIHI